MSAVGLFDPLILIPILAQMFQVLLCKLKTLFLFFTDSVAGDNISLDSNSSENSVLMAPADNLSDNFSSNSFGENSQMPTNSADNLYDNLSTNSFSENS